MARNKECLVIILDVRETANEDFKLKAVKSASEVLKDKICSGKKDLVTFVLVGTRRTRNLTHDSTGGDRCANIVQYPQAQEASWQLLINFFKFVNDDVCAWGEWPDALNVALDIFDSPDDVAVKFQRPRILLFYDFNGLPCAFDDFTTIANRLVQREVDLIVVSQNIRFIDNPDSGEPQAVFRDWHKKDEKQIQNEKYALRLISSANAKLCNFREAHNIICTVSNRRPWTWNAKLQIGTKLNIFVSGMIAVKDESNIVLKKCWGASNEVATRELKYVQRGEEIHPDKLDLVAGYMLGATAVPFESLEEEGEEDGDDQFRVKSEAALKFVGFTDRSSIPSEYFCGDSLYWIVHQRGRTASAKKLDALVKALLKVDKAMLCWKIYSAKHNNPKIVVLLPNELRDDRPASLAMIELAYHAQHHYWDFPTLATKKTACTDQQFEAIDQLIDAMDLTLPPKQEFGDPRETRSKDLLPFDMLPHIYEQNVMDFLERRILTNASEDDAQFEEMLEDKNFVEVFWRVPEEMEDRSKKAAQRVKQLFVLERVPIELGKAKAVLTQSADGSAAHRTDSQLTASQEMKYVNSVSLEEPVADFKTLLGQYVRPQKNTTMKKHLFDLYALQMRDIIWKLIFEMPQLDVEKVAAALRIYRSACYEFHQLDDYNNWLHELKAAVRERGIQLEGFWRDVMVAGKLGILEVSGAATTLEERALVEAFYALD